MADERLTIEDINGVTVATVHDGEIPPGTIDPVSKRVRQCAEQDQPVRVVLDMSQVSLMGSMALTQLVVLLKHVREAGGKLALTGVTGHPLGVLEVMALTSVFPLYESTDAAVAALREQA